MSSRALQIPLCVPPAVARSGRRPPGCSANQIAARRADPVHAAALPAPNVLNLLAIAGMITFDGLFSRPARPRRARRVSLAFPFVMLIQHTAASGMGGGVASAIAAHSV